MIWHLSSTFIHSSLYRPAPATEMPIEKHIRWWTMTEFGLVLTIMLEFKTLSMSLAKVDKRHCLLMMCCQWPLRVSRSPTCNWYHWWRLCRCPGRPRLLLCSTGWRCLISMCSSGLLSALYRWAIGICLCWSSWRRYSSSRWSGCPQRRTPTVKRDYTLASSVDAWRMQQHFFSCTDIPS